MIAVIIVIFLIYTFLRVKSTGSCRVGEKGKYRKNPPKPKDFDNYYVYKSALAQFNDEQYDEFLERCKNGECNYIEKDIISPELEKGNKSINELNNKL